MSTCCTEHEKGEGGREGRERGRSSDRARADQFLLSVPFVVRWFWVNKKGKSTTTTLSSTLSSRSPTRRNQLLCFEQFTTSSRGIRRMESLRRSLELCSYLCFLFSFLFSTKKGQGGCLLYSGVESEIVRSFLKTRHSPFPSSFVSFPHRAFDGRQNAFSTVPFAQDQTFEVGLQEQGSTSTEEVEEPSRRFKVVLREVNRIDSTQLQAYCKGELQAHQVQEVALTAIMAVSSERSKEEKRNKNARADLVFDFEQVNVLLRDDPSERFTPVGGGGNRFFGMSDRRVFVFSSHLDLETRRNPSLTSLSLPLRRRVALPQGATVGKGFFQSFRPTNLGYPAINLDTAYTVRSFFLRSSFERTSSTIKWSLLFE